MEYGVSGEAGYGDNQHNCRSRHTIRMTCVDFPSAMATPCGFPIGCDHFQGILNAAGSK